jgi:hypothetical protein
MKITRQGETWTAHVVAPDDPNALFFSINSTYICLVATAIACQLNFSKARLRPAWPIRFRSSGSRISTLGQDPSQVGVPSMAMNDVGVDSGRVEIETTLHRTEDRLQVFRAA